LFKRRLCLVLALWCEYGPVLLLLRLQVLLNVLLYVGFVWHFAIIGLVLRFVVLRLDGIHFELSLVRHSLVFLIIVGHVLEEGLRHSWFFLCWFEHDIHVLLIFFLCLLFGWTSRFLTLHTFFLELLKADYIVVSNFYLRNNVVIFLGW
jgi:hypothetical protein